MSRNSPSVMRQDMRTTRSILEFSDVIDAQPLTSGTSRIGGKSPRSICERIRPASPDESSQISNGLRLRWRKPSLECCSF